MALSPKLWFRLQKLKAAWRSAFRTKPDSYESSVRMCPACRALIDRNASVCPLCGTPIKTPRPRTSSSTPGRVLGGVIPIPSTATSVLVVANIAVYAISWYLTQTAASARLEAPPALGAIDTRVLIRLGAKSPLIFAGQWWRLVTAAFLHAGLLHVGMNLWCLFDLGPEVESLFSTTKFVFLYLATGILGFVASLWWSPAGVSVGASGAICGLIGILIGASFHHGWLGRQYRGQLWRWVLYILIFGVFFPVDNAAHLGGLLSGLVLGYAIPEGEPETGSSGKVWDLVALASVLVIAGSFVMMSLQLNRPGQ